MFHTFKTKNEAAKRLNEYTTEGVVFQYSKSKRWSFATANAPLYNDIADNLSLTDKTRAKIPHRYGDIDVQSVCFMV